MRGEMPIFPQQMETSAAVLRLLTSLSGSDHSQHRFISVPSSTMKMYSKPTVCCLRDASSLVLFSLKSIARGDGIELLGNTCVTP